MTVSSRPEAADATAARLQDALRRDPANVMRYNELANHLLAAGQAEKALALYRTAIALAPDAAALHFNLANALSGAGEEAAALEAYAAALARDPGFAAAHTNRGNLLRRLGRAQDALDAYRHALYLAPREATARYNLGTALLDLGRPGEALPYFEQAATAAPPYPPALASAGEALLRLGRRADARRWFGAALAQDAGDHAARMGLAVCLLAAGDYQAGWAAFEARLESAQARRSLPLLAGRRLGPDDAVAGRHVVVMAEQGFGDTLQFVRYVPLLRRRGAHVVLQVPAPLVELLTPLADEIMAQGEAPAAGPIPPHDLRCPLMSLPHAFGTTLETVPAAVPYLHPDPALVAVWRARLGAAERMRVGIAFSGSADHPEDALRSLPAAVLIAALPGVELHVVQRDVRAEDAAALATCPNVRRHAIGDFADTAALLACLDLVVSVDTSIAHLAGALGRPVWVLLQFAADFRWLRARADSPWYPTARLFRQAERGAWGPVLAAVTTSLRQP